MAQFFSDALDFFKSIADFIKMMVDSVVKFFELVPQVIGFGNSASGLLPTFLAPFLILGIALIIVKFVLDRL